MKTLLAGLCAAALCACKPAPPPVVVAAAVSTNQPAAAVAVAPAPSVPPVPAQRTVRGQVFVTLKNRSTVKLSLTPVLLVNGDALMPHLSTNRTTLSQALDLEAKVKRAEAEAKAAQDELARLVEIFNGNAGQTNRMSKEALAKYLPTHAQLLDRVADARAKRLACEAAHAAARREFAAGVAWGTDDGSVPSLGAVLFNRAWPGTITKTTANADGEFRLTGPAGVPLFVVAWSERSIPSLRGEPTVEKYRWLVRVPDDAEAVVDLHNRNMFNE